MEIYWVLLDRQVSLGFEGGRLRRFVEEVWRIYGAGSVRRRSEDEGGREGVGMIFYGSQVNGFVKLLVRSRWISCGGIRGK